MNREEWLNSATKELRQWVLRTKNGEPFEFPYVSIGFPKTVKKKGNAANAIGQCWDKNASEEKKRAHIFISPVLSSAHDVLSTLLHELIHASVGTKCGHRGAFRKVALELGFVAPMTSTPCGDSLREQLNLQVQWLGEYPHSALKLPKRGSVGSRMIKMHCGDCGYIARTSKKWLDLNGAVQCPCNGHSMMVVE